MRAGRWTAALWALALAGLLLVGSGAVAAKAGGILDGKHFSGETGEKGKDNGDPEEFVFKDGMFDPLQCHPWGFGAAPYTAKKVGEVTQFAATTVSAKEGKMTWTGRVRGDRIEGTMVWSKDGQEPADYWFRGTLKAE